MRTFSSVAKFDTDDYPEDRRLDALFEFFGITNAKEATVSDIGSFRYKSSFWKLGPLEIGRSFVSHVKWTFPELVTLEKLVLRVANIGEKRGVIANRPYCAINGGVSLSGTRHNFVFDRRNSDQISIDIPCHLVDFHPESASHFQFFPEGSSEAVFVTRFVNRLWASISSLSEREKELAAQAVCGLVGSLLRPDGHNASARSRLQTEKRTTIQDYLDENLTVRDLDIDEMCSKFGLSRSSLFRLFSDYGGVQRYIQKRRVDQAYVDLSLADPSPGLVSKVANKYQFADTSHFSNAFRTRFNTSARSIIGTANSTSAALAS